MNFFLLIFSEFALQIVNYVEQGFPTWGTRPPWGNLTGEQGPRGHASFSSFSKTVCVSTCYTVGGTRPLYFNIWEDIVGKKLGTKKWQNDSKIIKLYYSGVPLNVFTDYVIIWLILSN